MEGAGEDKGGEKQNIEQMEPKRKGSAREKVWAREGENIENGFQYIKKQRREW